MLLVPYLEIVKAKYLEQHLDLSMAKLLAQNWDFEMVIQLELHLGFVKDL